MSLARWAVPREVDMQMAETFLRMGYGLNETQGFQATHFLISNLRGGWGIRCSADKIDKSHTRFSRQGHVK